MLEPLVHGQDQAFAGTGQRAMVQETRQVCENAGILAGVPAKNFMDALRHRITSPLSLNKGLSHRDIVAAADQQRHPLVQSLRGDCQDAFRAGTGPTAGLLHHHREWIRLIQQAKLSLRLVRFRRIEIDAAADEEAMQVGHQAAGVSEGIRSPRGLVCLFQVVDESADAGNPFARIAFVGAPPTDYSNPQPIVRDIWIATVEGTSPAMRVTTPEDEVGVAWLPDGRIAALSYEWQG